jgi:hypothetical protein
MCNLKRIFKNSVSNFVTPCKTAHLWERHLLKTVLVDICYYVQDEKEHTRTNELLWTVYELDLLRRINTEKQVIGMWLQKLELQRVGWLSDN